MRALTPAKFSVKRALEGAVELGGDPHVGLGPVELGEGTAGDGDGDVEHVRGDVRTEVERAEPGGRAREQKARVGVAVGGDRPVELVGGVGRVGDDAAVLVERDGQRLRPDSGGGVGIDGVFLRAAGIARATRDDVGGVLEVEHPVLSRRVIRVIEGAIDPCRGVGVRQVGVRLEKRGLDRAGAEALHDQHEAREGEVVAHPVHGYSSRP